MFNWIANDTKQYLELLNFDDLCFQSYISNTYKPDLALNNLQWLIYYETKWKETTPTTSSAVGHEWQPVILEGGVLVA